MDHSKCLLRCILNMMYLLKYEMFKQLRLGLDYYSFVLVAQEALLSTPSLPHTPTHVPSSRHPYPTPPRPSPHPLHPPPPPPIQSPPSNHAPILVQERPPGGNPPTDRSSITRGGSVRYSARPPFPPPLAATQPFAPSSSPGGRPARQTWPNLTPAPLPAGLEHCNIGTAHQPRVFMGSWVTAFPFSFLPSFLSFLT